MAQFLLPGIATADRTGLVLDQREAVFDTDLNTVWVGDGSTAGGIEVGTGGGGSSLTQVVETDHNITAAANTRIVIPNGVLSANRNIDVSALTTDGDIVEIYNLEETYTLTFTGATVYGYGTDSVTDLRGAATYKITRVNGQLRQ